jgi:hypothetical protein
LTKAVSRCGSVRPAAAAALVDPLAGPADVGGSGRLGEDRAVRTAAGGAKAERPAHAENDRRYHGRRLPEADVAEVHVVALARDVLAREQAPDRDRRLLECPHRPCGERADLLHPGRHAVPEPGHEPARVKPRQGCDLHRRGDRVAEDGRHHPESDRDSLRGGERGRAGGDSAGEKAVLPKPQLVQAGGLGRGRETGQLLGRPVRTEDDTEPGQSDRV